MAAYDVLIMEHARAPRHAALTRPATAERVGENRLCGDAVRILAARDGQRLEWACVATGCAICRASGSLLMELAARTPTLELRGVIADFCAAFKSDAEPPPASPDLSALLALRRFPARTRCVLLAWETLAALLDDELS